MGICICSSARPDFQETPCSPGMVCGWWGAESGEWEWGESGEVKSEECRGGVVESGSGEVERGWSEDRQALYQVSY